jgi:hypothetical protein
MKYKTFAAAQTANWTRNDGGMTNAAWSVAVMASRIERLARKARRRGASGISAYIALVGLLDDDCSVVRDTAEMAVRDLTGRYDARQVTPQKGVLR